MPNLLRLELDCCTDMACHGPEGDYTLPYSIDHHIALVTQAANRHGVKADLVDESGPGGGHPVFAFTGTREQLTAYILTEYDQHANEDMDFYLESAEEV